MSEQSRGTESETGSSTVTPTNQPDTDGAAAAHREATGSTEPAVGGQDDSDDKQ